MFDELLLVCSFCYLLVFTGIQSRTVGAHDIPGKEKAAPETKTLQRKVSEALGIGNDVKA